MKDLKDAELIVAKIVGREGDLSRTPVDEYLDKNFEGAQLALLNEIVADIRAHKKTGDYVESENQHVIIIEASRVNPVPISVSLRIERRWNF